jgi:hypothetical protein
VNREIGLFEDEIDQFERKLKDGKDVKDEM